MAEPDNGVKLPVTDLGAIFNVRWALIHMPLVWDSAAYGRVATRKTLAVRLLAAQMQAQTHFVPLVAINVQVNRLMADVEQSCYLLGTAPVGQ